MSQAIRLGPFSGTLPRVAERLLPNNAAVDAVNLVITSGEIRPIKKPAFVVLPGGPSPWLSVYRAEYGGAEEWLSWNVDTDVARAPFSSDVEARYCWTGDNEPRYASFSDLPSTYYSLGIPAPLAAPIVSPSGGVGSAVSRVYVYTFFSALGEESAPSLANALVTGKVDDTWAISGMDGFPANTATIQAMPASFFVTPTNTFANATGSAVPITSSTNASPSVVTRVAHGYITDDRVYIVGHTVNTALNNTPTNPTWRVVRLTADTYSLKAEDGTAVNGNGVGGATGNAYKCTPHSLRAGEKVTTNLSATQYAVATVPSSFAFTINTTTDLHTATSWARTVNWNTSGMKRRLYRSAGTTATYQLVDDDVGTTYNDTLTDAQILGDELISGEWLLPPVGLRGIIALPSGSMCGFVGNLLCYSEPYQPHAWPVAYQYGTDFEIVAIESFGNVVVAATAGCPYYSSGNDPASTSLEKVDKVWPCLSKRSIASVGDGVVYATAYGMAYIGTSGPSIMTEPYFSKLEWVPLDPTSMVSAVSEGRIFVRWLGTNGNGGVMIFSPYDQVGLTTLSELPDELYSDARNGKLYLVDSTGVRQYDPANGLRLNYSWLSKEFHLTSPVNFGAAKVDFQTERTLADVEAEQDAFDAAVAANQALMSAYGGSGALGGAAINAMLLNGSNLANVTEPMPESATFSLFYNGVLKLSKTLITDQAAFRLPAGLKHYIVQVALSGTLRVKSVAIAETMAGLKAV